MIYILIFIEFQPICKKQNPLRKVKITEFCKMCFTIKFNINYLHLFFSSFVAQVNVINELVSCKISSSEWIQKSNPGKEYLIPKSGHWHTRPKVKVPFQKRVRVVKLYKEI